jgi:L-lactate utilization protein LutB
MIRTPSDLNEYRGDLRRALDNEFLGETLARFTELFTRNRNAAVADLDFEAAAQGVARLKDQAIPRLM